MRRFLYEALNNDGGLLNGELSAADERDVVRLLEQKGLTVLSVRSYSEKTNKARQGRLRQTDVIMAFYELATMLNSGVAIADAVEAQSSSAHHPAIVDAFSSVAAELRRGQSFSEALAKTNLPLPAYFRQLVKAGELTGKLGPAVSDGVEQMEYEHGLQNEMRNALIYPSILVLSGVGAVVLMFVFVVPKFASLLEKADQLPWLAWAVLSAGVWCNSHGIVLGVTLLALAFSSYALWKREKVRLRILEFFSRLPIIGDWLTESETARWSKVLGALLVNKVSLMDALELAMSGVRIPQRLLRLQEVSKAVRAGTPLSRALEDNDALTATGYNLIRVGEKSGELSAMLQSLARLYQESGRNRMKRLLILIEPVAILVIGMMIGTIIMGIILAITSANDLAI